MSGYANLSSEPVFNVFNESLLDANKDLFWTKIANVIGDTNPETIKAVALGAMSPLQKWAPGTLGNKQNLAQYKLNIDIDDYHTGYDIPVASYNAAGDVWASEIKSKAAEAAGYMQDLIVQTIKANGYGFDGVAFYGTSHIIGNQAAQSNSLSGGVYAAVSDATAPTATEMANCIIDSYVKLKSFKTETGTVASRTLKKLVLLTGSQGIYTGALASITAKTIQGSGGAIDNPLWALIEGGQLEVEAHIDPNVSSSNDYFLFNADEGKKAIVIGMGAPEDVSIFDEREAKKYNSYSFGVKVRYGVTFGRFYNSIKATLS